MSMMDPRFKVVTIAATPNPNQLVWRALHQCHSDSFVGECDVPSESHCGKIIIDRLLAGDRGHFGCLEHPSISLAVGSFPHSTMQQARTHRVGISFDVQSMRYTGDRIIKAANKEIDVEDVVYLRPVGTYTNREGVKFQYTEEWRTKRDLSWALDQCRWYKRAVLDGMPKEQARGMMVFDFRQDWVVSFNARSLMHFLDLRAKKDAQLEIQWLCDLLFVEFHCWMPELAEWYRDNRWGKAKLAP